MEVHKVATEADWVHFQIKGDVTGRNIPTVTASVFEPFRDSSDEVVDDRHLVLDFRAASFIDSSGIGWLLSLNRQQKQKGKQLIVHSVPPIIRRVFQMMRLSEVLTVTENFDQAQSQVSS